MCVSRKASDIVSHVNTTVKQGFRNVAVVAKLPLLPVTVFRSGNDDTFSISNPNDTKKESSKHAETIPLKSTSQVCQLFVFFQNLSCSFNPRQGYGSSSEISPVLNKAVFQRSSMWILLTPNVSRAVSQCLQHRYAFSWLMLKQRDL